MSVVAFCNFPSRFGPSFVRINIAIAVHQSIAQLIAYIQIDAAGPLSNDRYRQF